MEQMQPEKTEQLIIKAQHGDEAAMTELINLHAAQLKEFIQSELGGRLRQRLESQDVIQQVYLEALNSIGKFVDRGEGSFFAWLRKLAMNRICDVDRKAFQSQRRAGEIRAADLGPDHSMFGLLDELSGSLTSPSRAADRADQVRLLAKAMNDLSEDHCEVIRLRYLRQLSVSETAAEMNRSERAIRSLSVRAIMQLRELLSDFI
ncbi:MAG: sigma-70 family RNA polymerase sigma factor [Planctomycetota bacterium]